MDDWLDARCQTGCDVFEKNSLGPLHSYLLHDIRINIKTRKQTGKLIAIDFVVGLRHPQIHGRSYKTLNMTKSNKRPIHANYSISRWFTRTSFQLNIQTTNIHNAEKNFGTQNTQIKHFLFLAALSAIAKIKDDNKFPTRSNSGTERIKKKYYPI